MRRHYSYPRPKRVEVRLTKHLLRQLLQGGCPGKRLPLTHDRGNMLLVEGEYRIRFVTQPKERCYYCAGAGPKNKLEPLAKGNADYSLDFSQYPKGVK